MIGIILIGVLIVAVIALVATNVRIVPQAQAYVIERLGAYKGTWPVGLHFKIPFIDRIARKEMCIRDSILRKQPSIQR